MSKRRAPEFNNGESKRQEMDKKYCVRLIIPTKLGGKLIGKGGSVARGLRETHGCSLNIPNSECPERLVMVRGNELDGVVNCVQEIGEKLQEEIHQIANLKGENYTEIRMLVHQSICGAIIGRGGESIKKLREETGTAVRMNGDPCPGSTDRVCQIAGEPGNVGAALEAVLDILENTEIKGDEQQYDPRNYGTGEDVRKYGGFVGEPGDRYGRPDNRGPPMQGGMPHMRSQPPPPAMGMRQPDPRGPAPPASWQPPPNYPYPMPHYGQPPQGHYPPPHAHPYSPYSHPAPPAGQYGAPPPHPGAYYPPPPSGAYTPPTAGGDYYRQSAPPRPAYHGYGDRRDQRDRREGNRFV